MAIDDICPGAFADPPLIRFSYLPGSILVDWPGEARRMAAEMGYGALYDNAERARRQDIRAFLGGLSAHDPARWMVDAFDTFREQRRAQADPDAYPFSSKAIGEPTLDNCPTCKGTGEVTDYPPDDDERTVACGTCGGTGEVWQ